MASTMSMAAPSRRCAFQPAVAAEQDLQHGRRLRHHHDGCEQHREHGLGGDAGKSARRTEQLAGAMRALEFEPEPQRLRQQHDSHGGEEQAHGCAGINHRPDWKQGLAVREIARKQLLALQSEHEADCERMPPRWRKRCRPAHP